MYLENNYQKRRSVAVSWLLSYILVLIVPIIVSAVIYMESINIIHREIVRTNQSLLEEIQQVADAKLRDLERISSEISFNDRINDLINVDHLLPSDHTTAYIIDLFAEELRLFMLGNDFIEDIYIFHKRSDTLIGTSACLSQQSFYDAYIKPGGGSLDRWEGFLDNGESRAVMSVSVKNAGNSEDRFLLVRIPLVNQSEANIIFIVNASNLFHGVQDTTLLLSSYINVIDSSNNTIISTNYEQDYSFINYDALSKDILIREKHNSDEYVIMHVASNVYKWRYLMIVNVNAFWTKAQYIKQLMLLALLLCLVIGGIVCFFFVKRNYNPISMLVNTLMDKEGANLSVRHNELQFLQDAMINVLDKHEKVTGWKKQQEKILRNNFLSAFLKGRIATDIKADEYMDTYHIVLQYDCFVILLFYLEDHSALSLKDKKVDSIKEYIANIVARLEQNKRSGYVCEIDHMLACIMNFDGNASDEDNQELIQISQNVQHAVEEHFKICLSISISNIHKTMQAIPVAYQEALEAMEYKMVIGTGKILQYSDITKNYSCAANQYYYPLQLENQLINCIKAADAESAKKIVYQIFDMNFSERSISIQMTKCLTFNIISTMIKAVNEISDIYGNHFADEIDPVQCLIDCETIDKMKLVMIHILEESCMYVEKQKTESKRMINVEIEEYIQINFKDSDLSVSKVAEYFNMSPSYMSKQFKEQTGISLLDFIGKKRIEEVKQLLLQHDYTIQEAAKQVGYYDIKTFIRNFKKFEGITPGKFKELH